MKQKKKMGNSIASKIELSQQIKLDEQSFVVPNSKVEGWTEIRRSQVVKDGELIETHNPEVRTLYENFRFVFSSNN